jgi:glycosyltransferase involved in cell wall biosynthesis
VSRYAPFLSVIVPAHQAESILPDTLGALVLSDLPKDEWELIVIDDASRDQTALVAAEYADTVVRLSGRPHGPSYARNRGVEASRGDVLVFVDADVRIHETSLRQFAEAFRADPDLASVFGSYDDQPPAEGVVSRYRNLLHHYHHHKGAGVAGTFWAGLGAVRADVFAEVDKYDEWRYERPQIEDIELGRRMARAGYRIMLDPTIQGAHLKRWTLRDVLRTDLLHRGIPWITLMLREGGGGGMLNVKPKEKVCVGLLGLACVTPVLALPVGRWAVLGLIPLFLGTILALNVDLYRFMYRGRGLRFLLAVIPLHLAYYFVSGLAAVLGHVAHWLGREPQPSARTRELSEQGVESWPPVPVRPRSSTWET